MISVTRALAARLPVILNLGPPFSDPECVENIFRHIANPLIASDKCSFLSALAESKTPATLIVPGGSTYCLAHQIGQWALTERIQSAVKEGWQLQHKI